MISLSEMQFGSQYQDHAQRQAHNANPPTKSQAHQSAVNLRELLQTGARDVVT
jgi:hypothetical protein